MNKQCSTFTTNGCGGLFCQVNMLRCIPWGILDMPTKLPVLAHQSRLKQLIFFCIVNPDKLHVNSLYIFTTWTTRRLPQPSDLSSEKMSNFKVSTFIKNNSPICPWQSYHSLWRLHSQHVYQDSFTRHLDLLVETELNDIFLLCRGHSVSPAQLHLSRLDIQAQPLIDIAGCPSLDDPITHVHHLCSMCFSARSKNRQVH